MDQFYLSQGFLIHLINWGSIKKTGSNLALDGQDGLAMGLKFEIKYMLNFGNPNQSLIEPKWLSNQAIGLPRGATTYKSPKCEAMHKFIVSLGTAVLSFALFLALVPLFEL